MGRHRRAKMHEACMLGPIIAALLIRYQGLANRHIPQRAPTHPSSRPCTLTL
jgi:hypothetical protein